MPDKSVVINTSCLIALSKLDLLQYLCDIYTNIIITNAVVREFGNLNLKCLKIQKVNSPLVELLKTKNNLGSGESEVIVFAYENNLTAIIDDKRARMMAKTLNVTITGTIGVLLKLENNGIIKSAYDKALKLKETGFYLSDILLNDIRKV